MSTAKKRVTRSQAPATPAAAAAEGEGLPVYDEASARAAFEKLSSWFAELSPGELRPLDVDAELAVRAALSLSRQAADDQLNAKFHAVPAFFFDVAVLDHLPLAARALWYASRRLALAESGSPEAKSWADAQQRAWTFLLGTYTEVAETGFWLERGNKRRDELFPPLRAAARAPHLDEPAPSPEAPQRSGERPTPS